MRPLPRSASRILTGLSLLMLLGLGGAASAAGEAESGAKVAANDPAAEFDELPSFVPLQNLQVPIVDAGAMTGRLKVEIVLQADTPEALANIQRDLPLLRDRAFTAALEHARLHISPYMAVDAERLSAALGSELKDPGIRRVLITQVTAEPA